MMRSLAHACSLRACGFGVGSSAEVNSPLTRLQEPYGPSGGHFMEKRHEKAQVSGCCRSDRQPHNPRADQFGRLAYGERLDGIRGH